MLITVFDPLAVVLLLAFNMSLKEKEVVQTIENLDEEIKKKEVIENNEEKSEENVDVSYNSELYFDTKYYNVKDDVKEKYKNLKKQKQNNQNVESFQKKEEPIIKEPEIKIEPEIKEETVHFDVKNQDEIDNITELESNKEKNDSKMIKKYY